MFQLPIFLNYVFSWRFAEAAFQTLWISLGALALGMTIGLLLALGQQSRWRALRTVAAAYLWLFRGTPVLLQIVFAFNVLPSFGIVMPGYACAILALGLHEGAYMAEIMRAGLNGVDPGQRSAAQALGLRDAQVMRLVVIPQAVRIIIPPTGNQFIGMLKLSALISVIGVRELLLTADQASASNFRYFETLAAAAVYYLLLTTLFMLIQRRIERVFDQPGFSSLRMPA